MKALSSGLEEAVEAHDFSGVVRVLASGHEPIELARGDADRTNGRANALTTRFGVASGTKGLTAITVMSLVESGDLALDTPVRSIVGDELDAIDHAVTIDHLLTHRSGVGDYLDEDMLGDIDDHVLGSRSAHTLQLPQDYVELLNGHPQVSRPGERFAYNNSGYVTLSLVIERVTGSFHETVAERVLGPAGMERSGFLRSDGLPADSALGYLANGRTNVFHLPVIGAGDGGIYLTLDDTFAFWDALLGGRILSAASVDLMRSVVSVGDVASYGRGFWLDEHADHMWLEGMDAGVSFQSGVVRSTGLTYAVLSNTSSGAWPVAKLITSTAGG